MRIDWLYNAVALLDGGKIEGVRLKADLPNYGVFDEKRVFAAGPMPGPINMRGVRVGVPICEDIWGEEVVETLVETGAEIIDFAQRFAVRLAKARSAHERRRRARDGKRLAAGLRQSGRRPG